VVVAEQVQEAVREIAVELRAQCTALLARSAACHVQGDHHVSEERARAGGGKRQHVGRAILAAPPPVEAAHRRVGHDQDGELGATGIE